MSFSRSKRWYYQPNLNASPLSSSSLHPPPRKRSISRQEEGDFGALEKLPEVLVGIIALHLEGGDILSILLLNKRLKASLLVYRLPEKLAERDEEQYQLLKVTLAIHGYHKFHDPHYPGHLSPDTVRDTHDAVLSPTCYGDIPSVHTVLRRRAIKKRMSQELIGLFYPFWYENGYAGEFCSHNFHSYTFNNTSLSE
jgi:hypothetical protein